MKPKPILLALALLPLLAPGVEAGERPWAPTAVLAASGGLGAVVAWTPGEVVADHYNVYGMDGTTLVLVDVSVAPLLDVETADVYPAYAVSGVKGGIESEPVPASVSPCVHVRWDPVDVSWDLDCRGAERP